ncbi:MAG: tetratricopeptide repeat protein [Gemmatimonadaceae bacterium]
MRMLTPTGAALAAALAAAAIAPAPARAQRAADNIARLERAQRSSPRNAAVLRTLGIAYYRAGRYADARPVLEKARALDPKSGVTALYLGMTAEKQNDMATAKDAYASYLRHGRASRVRSQLRSRLAAVQRAELAQAAREAVARETQLAATPGSPKTIAVMPLRFSGSDSSLVPLERGIAALMVTDLSVAKELTILERERVQALIDEVSLNQSGRVDQSLSVRAGRMLSAGRLVQAGITQLPDRALRLDAAVIDVPTTQALSNAQAENRLEQIFALEKQVVMQILGALGVRLTTAEREQLEQRPTRSLQAFLAYSSGLLAEDNGNLELASRFFGDAVRIDPGFSAAAAQRSQVDAARAGAAVSTGSVESALLNTAEGQAVAAADAGVVGGEVTTLTAIANDLNPSVASQTENGTTSTNPGQRDPASSSTNTDNPAGGTGRITIIIRQPGASVAPAPRPR